jgi:rod shape-determining protein MreC
MRKREWLPLLLLALAVVLLLSNRLGKRFSPRGWLSRASTAGQAATTTLLHNLGNAGVFFQNLDQLRQENQLLKSKVDDLTVQVATLQEVARENEMLRAEMGFASSQSAVGLHGADVTGRVVGGEPGSLIRALVVAAGRDTGLLPDMPVVTGRGLVGRVIEVEPTSSKVMLIDDPRSSVAALVQRTRAAGLLKGQVDGTLVMDDIGRDEDVQVGDIILTSGLGGVFPKGIVIGQVSQVLRNDRSMFQKAIISPSANLDSLEVVLIMTNPRGDAAQGSAGGTN